MLKSEYSKIGKKYGLPSFDHLNKEFEIQGILTESGFLLREIRRNIEERINTFIDVIEPLLQPENSFIQLHEYKVYSDQDRTRLLLLLKNLMTIIREALIVRIDNREKVNAKFINDTYKLWHNITVEMAFVATKLKSAWEKDIDVKQNLEYMG